jgi:hypothetical protein
MHAPNGWEIVSDVFWMLAAHLPHETRSRFDTATARWIRGERLSARRYLSHFAVDALLKLVAGMARASEASVRDPLDPRRRIERDMPEFAASLDRIVVADVPAASISLLHLAEQQLLSLWPSYPVEETTRVRDLLTRTAAG